MNTIEYAKKKLIRNTYKIMFILFIIFSYILTIINANSYLALTSDYRTKVGVYPEINTSFLDSTITLGELENLIAENKSAIIYFERSDCPECIALTPNLTEYLDNYGEKYYLYNTLDDRNNNYEKLIKILSLYSVESVPTLVKLKNGKIIEVFEQEALFDLVYSED